MKHVVLISFLLIALTGFSQRIVDFQTSECERDSYPEFIHRNRLIHKKLHNDTLILQVGIVRNCSFSPEIDFNFNEDMLFLKVRNKSNDYAACNCCYELTIRVVGIADTNFTLGEKFKSGDYINGEL